MNRAPYIFCADTIALIYCTVGWIVFFHTDLSTGAIDQATVSKLETIVTFTVLKNRTFSIVNARVGHSVLFRSVGYILFRSKKRMFRSFPFFSRVFGDL